MKTYCKFSLLLLLVLPFRLSAQSLNQNESGWTLQKCIEYAWDNNLSIRLQELSVEQSENNLLQSKLNFIPSFSTSLSHSMNWGRSVNMNDLQIIQNKLSQSTSASARASVNLFEGFAKSNDLKSKMVLKDISGEEVDKLKNDISIEIARSYLQILLSKEIVKTAQESLNSVEEQVERTRKMVEQGSLAHSSLLEMEAQLATERVQAVNAGNQLTSALLILRQLLDLNDGLDFDIEDMNIDFLVTEFRETDIDALFRISGSLLPQMKIAELNMENSTLQLNIAKGRAMPVISLSAGYGSYFSDTREDPFFTQFRDNRNPSLSLGFSIPIFNNYQIKTSIQNAKLNVRRAEIEMKSREQALYKEIQQASNDALAAFEKFKASETNVRAMQESFRYVHEKFELGILNATDYTVARANLFRAQSDYYQSKYQYVFQLKILDFYKGLPIYL